MGQDTMADRGEAERPLRSFVVRCRHEPPHRAHTVEAESFECAAVAFAEVWAPEALTESGQPASVLVRDPERGDERCFTIEFGEAEPCE